MKKLRGRTAVPLDFDADPVLWAAWLYYEDGLRQDEIADHLGISRASVFNLLQKAREDGIVTITIDPSRIKLLDLARQVREETGLTECFIVPDVVSDHPLFERIARLGARLIEQRLEEDDVLGVAWGGTVMALSKALSPMSRPGTSVVQVTGSSIATYDFSPELCASNIAVRIGARCINLHAPGIVSSARMKKLLMQEPVIRQHFDVLRSCTKTLFGVTHIGSETLLKHSGFMSEQSLAEYKALGAVGFASGYFFDETGRTVTTDLDARHIVMPLKDFIRVPQRICVGGGPDKIAAIRGMLKGGFATVLVTDERTARSVIDPDA